MIELIQTIVLLCTINGDTTNFNLNYKIKCQQSYAKCVESRKHNVSRVEALMKCVSDKKGL